MATDVRRVSASDLVRAAELLDIAFPLVRAVPDYLSHDCQRAEEALLTSIGKRGMTRDEDLALLLGLTVG